MLKEIVWIICVVVGLCIFALGGAIIGQRLLPPVGFVFGMLVGVFMFTMSSTWIISHTSLGIVDTEDSLCEE